MAQRRAGKISQAMAWLRVLLGRLDVIALFPLLTVLAVWFGAEDMILAIALLLSGLVALDALGRKWGAAALATATPISGRAAGQSVHTGQEALLQAMAQAAALPQRDTACLLVQIDMWDAVLDRWGADTAQEIAQRCLERICTSLRPDDVIGRLGDARFGIVLHPVAAARLGTRDAIAQRLRNALAEPIAIAGSTARVTASIGHSNLLREAPDIAAATYTAAEAALTEAHRIGPNAVCAYAPGLGAARQSRNELASAVEGALADGDIRPWFQPQIACDSGAVSGFEALARWHHPDHGVLTPGDFMQAIEDAGRMEALGHSILFHALSALQAWDRAGLRIPSVSVNFSAAELRNPGLVDRVKWEIDRFDLRPGRITVEILETVAAGSKDDSVMQTLRALGAHGINLDLDDFGIGQASLAAIRRFGVSRIKIDRSFIAGLDTDAEQQSMVSAILAMARHLGVETLAEGVESQNIQTMLAQMGCDHIQGYHVARPMPFDDTTPWALEHARRMAARSGPRRRAG